MGMLTNILMAYEEIRNVSIHAYKTHYLLLVN